MTTPELKPCPFCGRYPTLRHWDYPYTRFQVRCRGCKTTVGSRVNTAEKAIEKWNTRHEVNNERA